MSHRRGSRTRRELSERSFSGSEYGSAVEDNYEIYSGPISESIPSSVSAFHHRYSTSESVNEERFHFFTRDELEDAPIGSEYDNEQASDYFSDMESEFLSENYHARRSSRRRYTQDSEMIVHDPYDDDDRHTWIDGENIMDEPLLASHLRPRRQSEEEPLTYQKFYLEEEDVMIVIAGYNTQWCFLIAYYCTCIVTLGLAFLFFRWFPRYWIKFVGRSEPLSSCQWVVIENQWGEMTVTDVNTLDYGFRLSSVFNLPSENLDNNPDFLDPVLQDLRSFSYRYTRFFYNPLEDMFLINVHWKDHVWQDLWEARSGIDSTIQKSRQVVFGSNVIDIEEKSIMQLLIGEVLHPFYVFQVFSIILWLLDEYYYYASCIFLISAVSIGETLTETKRTIRRLREVSRFICSVRVLHNGFWMKSHSDKLVPGDVIEVSDPDLCVLPCDVILLSGEVIVNESMLTGESVPISKYPVDTEGMKEYFSRNQISSEVSRHMLFSGTKIVRVQRPIPTSENPDAIAIALVTRIGFNTTKGSLVRSMLFPRPLKFKFYYDSFKYIGVMAIMAALGFIYSLIQFAKMKLPVSLMLLRAFDLITIVVPPALPATLSIGSNIALSQLRKAKIFCISPSKINVCGKLNIVCFDKTGTLTEEGLDVLGLHITDTQKARFNELITNVNDISFRADCLHSSEGKKDYDVYSTLMFLAMSSCHSLRLVEDELVGDPLDFKMFCFTDCMLEEEGQQFLHPERSDAADDHVDIDQPAESEKLIPAVVHMPHFIQSNHGEPSENISLDIAIIRRFDFISKLRRMSVIVKPYKAKNAFVFVKGAPEIMPDVCKKESFPKDYDKLLHHYTRNGFRVIGVAAKQYANMSWFRAQKLSRDDVESELEFVGFIIFENKLKPATTSVIHELRDADIRQVMCTGDNILTAVSVSKECGLVPQETLVYVPHLDYDQMDIMNSRIEWECVDNAELTLDPDSLLPRISDLADTNYDTKNIVSNYSIAVSGDVFRWIIEFGTKEQLNFMLLKSNVFARMSPDEKNELVVKLQELDYCVAFCGDGANDCGALRSADVGVSLSEAEASVAAPFTSQTFDVSCIPKVIKEGRSALVTSFGCFRYMSLYSAIQFVSVTILYSEGTNLGDFQFLFIDLFLIIPVAIFMAWSKPYPKLSKKRPTSNLVSRKVLIPLISEIVICGLLQLFAWAMCLNKSWRIAPLPGSGDDNVWSTDNTILFIVSCFEYIIISFFLCGGPPYQMSIWYNIPYLVNIVVALLAITYILFIPADWVVNIFNLVRLPTYYCLFILGLTIAGSLILYIGERWIFPFTAELFKRSTRSIFGTKDSKKRFKVLLEESVVEA
ncbi:hypothetical protein CANCADRAFT_30324 [Tortispora caseinolytica NRRL Y-17796]|uniref:Cation-transporting ATPase n=1 Tax=Tortispora caseinolytica NRRL Y-17796 TaxID=767744 RepID=A0A1E4TJW5_9ASCO|nr:hypothetical protein CANCADRAFT_30324 [Tortispora caseinolytica NRRL Y-17796]